MLVLCGPMVTLRFATADFMGPSILLGLARWTAADTKYDDNYPTYTNWGDPVTPRPYRCVFSNELR